MTDKKISSHEEIIIQLETLYKQVAAEKEDGLLSAAIESSSDDYSYGSQGELFPALNAADSQRQRLSPRKRKKSWKKTVIGCLLFAVAILVFAVATRTSFIFPRVGKLHREWTIFRKPIQAPLAEEMMPPTELTVRQSEESTVLSSAVPGPPTTPPLPDTVKQSPLPSDPNATNTGTYDDTTTTNLTEKPLDANVQGKSSQNTPREGYTIQVGAFRTREEAGRTAEKFITSGMNAFIREATVGGSGVWYRTFVGQFPDKTTAISSLEAIKKNDPCKDCFIKKLDSLPSPSDSPQH